jgi:exodeoxyribonuclease-5
VLRMRGVPATTIHRILYTPVYDPEYEKIAEWLAEGASPEIEGLTEAALDRAEAFYKKQPRSPVPWRRRGCAGRISSPAGSGARIRWISASSTRPRCSMTSSSRTCKEIFPTLVLFGDPCAAAAGQWSGEDGVRHMPEARKLMELHRIHRQDADNPILDLAHALADPDLGFEAFERMVEDTAKRDDRVVWASGSRST